MEIDGSWIWTLSYIRSYRKKTLDILRILKPDFHSHIYHYLFFPLLGSPLKIFVQNLWYIKGIKKSVNTHEPKMLLKNIIHIVELPSVLFTDHIPVLLFRGSHYPEFWCLWCLPFILFFDYIYFTWHQKSHLILHCKKLEQCSRIINFYVAIQGLLLPHSRWDTEGWFSWMLHKSAVQIKRLLAHNKHLESTTI